MKTKYALINSKSEFFSHFTEWQGTVHANWNSTKIKIFNSMKVAKQRADEIKKLCFEDVNIFAVVLHKREVQSQWKSQ